MHQPPVTPTRTPIEDFGIPPSPEARAGPPASKVSPLRGRPLGCLLLIVVLLAGAGFASVHLYRKQGTTNGSGAGRKGPMLIPVTVGRVSRKTVPVELHAVGNVLAYSTVAVTSQVTGQVKKVHFQQGDFVSRGQVLFTIDARSQEATLQQVEATTTRDAAQISQAEANVRKTEANVQKDEANVRRDEANLRQAEANLARDRAQQRYAMEQEKRYRALLGQGYVTLEQHGQVKATADSYSATILAHQAAIASARASLAADRATLAADIATLAADRASVRGLEATLEANRAVVRGAAVQVGFTVIRSPLDGRTGSLTAYEGNVVRANDVTPLVTINQVTPIYVSFALPEHHLTQVRARQAAGPLVAQVTMSGQKLPPESGRVTFFDNAVDATTGTITLRATLPNVKKRLWPGRFVNVNLLLDQQKNAIVAPSQAIQAGQDGDYVFVLEADGRVAVRPVKIERTVGDLSVIGAGLQPGETVITDGQLQLTPGAKVQIRTGKPGRIKGLRGAPEGEASPGTGGGPQASSEPGSGASPDAGGGPQSGSKPGSGASPERGQGSRSPR